MSDEPKYPCSMHLIGEQDKVALDLVWSWCESYSKFITFLTTIAASVLIFTATYIFKDSFQNENVRDLIHSNFWLLTLSWACFFIASVFGLLARFATYRWFAAALSGYAKEKLIYYKWEYFNYTKPKSMQAWGQRSTWLGILLGFFLIVGTMSFLGMVGKAMWQIYQM